MNLDFHSLGPQAPPPELLLAHAPNPDAVAALISGPGAPELSRWSCFAQTPAGVVHTLEDAEEYARAAGDARALVEQLPIRLTDTLPFLTGAIGHLTYEAGWRFSARPRVPRPHPFGIPEVRFSLYDAVYLYDRREGSAHVVTRKDAEARRRGDALRALADRAAGDRLASLRGGLSAPLRAAVPRAEHEARIRRALSLVADGEVYQVNLTYPLVGRFDGDPRAAFDRLLRTPPPFAAFLGLGPGRAIVSGSPECFATFRLADGFARTYPIKGTRPRSDLPDADRAQARELLASEKDRAEHLMIVDLLRNDLGRFAQAGGVEVSDLAYLESFPTVHHLTSRIAARLEPGLSASELLRGLFPGGSITGAPKLRAMQIIDRLEGAPRGVYTGSIVALSPLGLVASIAIRTAEIADGQLRVGVGGGIVHDSDPRAEWSETRVKARAISSALTAETSDGELERGQR